MRARTAPANPAYTETGMACPFFEPSHVISNPRHPSARLPLIDEYDGLCHAATTPIQAPGERRFECCNRGYPYPQCSLFPMGDGPHCLRYSILEQSACAVRLVLIEERDYSPLAWRTVQYSITTEELMPEVVDACARAQVIAFCRSFLKRFS